MKSKEVFWILVDIKKALLLGRAFNFRLFLSDYLINVIRFD